MRVIPPLPFTLPYAFLFWAAYLWAFFPEARIIRAARRSPAAHGTQDAGSLRFILLASGGGALLAFLAAWAVPRASLTGDARLAAFWAGLVVMVAASVLRRHCFRVLGQWFTGAVEVRAEQPVITAGAYRWIRHPSYTAGGLLWIGIGLALGNWVSLLILTLTVIAAYGYRVRAEERALLATIGEPYRAYMARTRRFIPFLF